MAAMCRYAKLCMTTLAIGVGDGDHRSLPPNPVCGFPARALQSGLSPPSQNILSPCGLPSGMFTPSHRFAALSRFSNIYPSGGYFQQPLDRSRRWQSQIFLEGLPPRITQESNVPGCTGVHSPLPAVRLFPLSGSHFDDTALREPL